MRLEYDVIVVGAGHAGCEAASAAARLGASTLLITIDLNKIAQMSCNPAVGGIAKGQIVREIDALGGRMGVITDRASIQFRMLNRSKGPAMWSPRAQIDRMRFSEYWRHELEQTPNLWMWQDSVTGLTIDNDGEKPRVTGVETALGMKFTARAVVLTNGTFLNGLMHIGRVQLAGGRCAEPPATGITEQLRSLGFAADRMKTGTPVRLDGRTIHFDLTTPQELEEDFHHFSYLPGERSKLRQRRCYNVWTSPETHEVLRRGLPDSPLYNGQIQSIGPRYCPSIETKIVTFADKESHQLFLEPEGEETTEYYLNGFSSSLPIDIQIEALRTIPALKDVHLFRPGYAIEYDFFDPTQLRHTLETKLVDSLFFAGQINGTTGYEEAAGQGLVAGANAAFRALDADSAAPRQLTLRRDQAYIGVLIDDLVTKGVDEPYRMFTSRAEYRILLRQDDADARLTPLAFELGLAGQERLDLLNEKMRLRDGLIDYIRSTSVKAADINAIFEAVNNNEALAGTMAELTPVTDGCKLAQLVLRPQLNIALLASHHAGLAAQIAALPADRRDEITESAEVLLKYDGYIQREALQAEKLNRLEAVPLGDRFDYSSITALSTEARQKLDRIRPATIGQASRIPGVSPADINILLLMSGR